MPRTIPLFISTLFIVLGTVAQAVELLSQPEVVPNSTGAVVTWKTDVDCGTRLSYGLNAAQLTQKAAGPVTSVHAVTLESLRPGTTYHYSVGSARTKLHTGTFTTTSGTQAAATTPKPSFMRRVLNAIMPGKKTPIEERPAVAAQAPPASQTWGNMYSLRDHYERHGRDFGSKNADDYAAQAWHFLQRARTENLPMKLDNTDGTLRVFDPKSRAFAAYTKTGRTKTYFRPDSPTYWQRQPGRLVKATDLRFK